MGPSRTALALAVDALAQANRVAVTESSTELALYQLAAADARMVVGLLDAAGFTLSRLVDEGGDVPIDHLNDGADGIELLATKPLVPEGVLPILTRTAFAAVLDRVPDQSIIWVQGLELPLEMVSVCYLPWGDERAFLPQEDLPDPARVVRSLVEVRLSQPIGRWVLRDPNTDVSGPFLVPWRRRAVEVLLASLAQEIELDHRLMFRGPPTARFRLEGAENVDVGALSAVQRAVAWVYENPRELENRHGLLAAEVARTALRDGSLADLASVLRGALEGAKIAYGFGVSRQSLDALKALSDLRKAVSDETGKLSDATRSVAAAVTTAAIGNVGLVIARVTVPKDMSFITSAAILIGIALAFYVAVVIASGWHFLAIQRDLRADWRERLYRFLPDDEYGRMVTVPVERAERGFVNAAIGSGIIAGLLLVAVMVIAASC